MEANCAVCGETVAIYDQADHLRLRHPTPTSGFKFWLNGRMHATEKPSMLVRELIAATDSQVIASYLFEDDAGKQYAHDNAVDLTQEPHFFMLPPATY